MEALEAILTRRSTRNFRPDPVAQEKLDRILVAGRQAPSGGNSQTNHFLVIRSRAVLDTLIRMTEEAFAAMEADEYTYASLRRHDEVFPDECRKAFSMGEAIGRQSAE